MAENQAGITALITAYARAYHATHASPRIFDDFLADQYFTPAEHIEFDRLLAGMIGLIDPELAASHPDQETALARVMQIQHAPIALSRARYTEDALAELISAGLRQYVILGAGLDTFAFRRPDLAGRLEIFEVDHPATQAIKRKRIAMAGWSIPENLHFVPIDFTKQNLAGGLAQTPYDPGRLTFFSWLGVTYYLSREVIDETLRALRGLAPASSQVVWDYMDLMAFDPHKAAQRMQLMHRIAVQVGEPMKSGFDPRALAVELRELGFDLVENVSPEEIQARYFTGRQDAYRAFEHVHFARAAVGRF